MPKKTVHYLFRLRLGGLWLYAVGEDMAATNAVSTADVVRAIRVTPESPLPAGVPQLKRYYMARSLFNAVYDKKTKRWYWQAADSTLHSEWNSYHPEDPPSS